jgi:hypothetical protein
MLNSIFDFGLWNVNTVILINYYFSWFDCDILDIYDWDIYDDVSELLICDYFIIEFWFENEDLSFKFDSMDESLDLSNLVAEYFLPNIPLIDL